MKTADKLLLTAAFALFGYALGTAVFSKAYAETETVRTFNHNTGSFRSETITRERGQVEMRGYDYRTGDHYQYQGDSDGGQGFNYGSGSFTTTYGNPYGVEE